MKKILILNGPNLNKLGEREPEIYGKTTLQDINKACDDKAKSLGFVVDFYQSNSEGEIINHIHQSAGYSGLIINAAAYTHTSVAIMDALKTIAIPVIEVHLSNIFAREEFRHHSFISPVAKGVICGLGINSYILAIEALAQM